MIDIHAHIVPGVDDGPKTLGDVEGILEFAVKEGITKIIATSHRNHPMDFSPTTDYESSFLQVESLVESKFPELEVYRGAELYIREGFHEILDSKDYDFTINNGKYVLIEFPYDAKYNMISDAVYELMVRGYVPILAHIDRYPTLFEEKNRIKEIRDQGAYVQVSSQAMTGDFGKKNMNDMKRLLKNGYIDFIASDSHSLHKRKPELRRAYDIVAKHSKTEADRIFIHNPNALIAGADIERIETKNSIKNYMDKVRNKT